MKKTLIYLICIFFTSCSSKRIEIEIALKMDNPQVYLADSLRFTYSLSEISLPEGELYITNVFKQDSRYLVTLGIENISNSLVLTPNNNYVGRGYNAYTGEWIESLSPSYAEPDTAKSLYVSIAPGSSIKKQGTNGLSLVPAGKYYFKAPNEPYIFQSKGVSDTIMYNIPLSILFEIK